MLIDKNDPRSDIEQFKAFVDACHNRGIRVMVDMPSCASYDLYNDRPDLMAHERNGLAKLLKAGLISECFNLGKMKEKEL